MAKSEAQKAKEKAQSAAKKGVTQNPPTLNQYQQSFQDVFDKRKPIKKQRRADATAAMGDAYKTDISKYNYKSAGNTKFDMKDVKALRAAGYDDDAIAKYSSGLKKHQLSESIRHNHQAFAGQHGTKGFDKSKGIESFDVGKGFNMSDVRYLRNQGYSDNEIAKHANKSVLEGGKRHGNAMAKFMHSQGHLNYMHGDWKNAKEKAQSQIDKSVNSSGNSGNNSGNSGDNSGNTDNSINDSFNTDNSFNVDGNLDQNIGKRGDMNTTIGDNNSFGAGSSIGNDYSVTIGNQNAGNRGNGSGTGNDALANMQSVAAYSALNNNAWAKSRSQLNGYGRAAGASEEAAKTTGATDRVASLYNLTGMDQEYWKNKATAQQGSYLGDIYNFSAPDWIMPSAPKKPEDKTEEIASGFNP